MNRRIRHGCCFIGQAILCLVFLTGCALFERSDDSAHDAQHAQDTRLPHIRPSWEAIHLEIVRIDRPSDDPLLGHELWQEVDQVAALPPDIRAKLKDAGLRVGQVGSTLPPTLQTLLGLTSATSTEDAAKQFTVRRVALPSGGETEIETSRTQPVRWIRMPGADSDQPTEYQMARCVLRVKAERVQDGWVRLQCIPEIHHGYPVPRPTATPAGWQVPTSQKIEPLFGLRFSLNLALNEMAIITAEPDAAESVGSNAFVGADGTAFHQRLLLIRFAEMRNIDPVYAE